MESEQTVTKNEYFSLANENYLLKRYINRKVSKLELKA